MDFVNLIQNIKPQVESIINRRFLVHRTLKTENQPMVKITNPIWQEIDGALRQLGKRQRWLAEQLHLSENAISKWRATGKISRENAVAVSELLNIPLDRLLAGKPNPIVEALDALPFDRSKTLLTQFMYQIEHANDVLTGKQISHYRESISKMIDDMERKESEKTRDKIPSEAQQSRLPRESYRDDVDPPATVKPGRRRYTR